MRKLIQQSLQQAAVPKKGELIANYMKNVLPFRGLQQPAIAEVFKQYKQRIMELDDTMRFKLAEELIYCEHGEDKKVGLMICEYVSFNRERVVYTEKWFTDGQIKEWASTDTYCMRVLKRYLQDQDNARLMEDWAKHENLWVRRSSCVGFVTMIRKHDVDMEMLYRICAENIQHQERFNQLGTGWLLREMSQKDLVGVIHFIESHMREFTSEGLRYAYEKMKKKDQDRLKLLHQSQRDQSESAQKRSKRKL